MLTLSLKYEGMKGKSIAALVPSSAWKPSLSVQSRADLKKFGMKWEHFQRDKFMFQFLNDQKLASMQSQMQKRGNPQHSEFKFIQGQFEMWPVKVEQPKKFLYTTTTS